MSFPEKSADAMTGAPVVVPPVILAVVRPTRVTNRIRALRFSKGEYSPSLEVAFKTAQVFAVPLEEVFQCPGTGS